MCDPGRRLEGTASSGYEQMAAGTSQNVGSLVNPAHNWAIATASMKRTGGLREQFAVLKGSAWCMLRRSHTPIIGHMGRPVKLAGRLCFHVKHWCRLRVVKAQGLSEAVLEAGRNDLAAYLTLVHKTDMAERAGGWAKPAAHHYQMIDILTDASLGHTVLLYPRGAGKTTMVQAWIEWELGRASLRGGNWAEEERLL